MGRTAGARRAVRPTIPSPSFDDIHEDDELARLAKAIAHPIRVRILRMLAKKEARMCSAIVDELPLAQSTVSEHLRILKASGLVRSNETGACVGYCIVPAALKRFKGLVAGI